MGPTSLILTGMANDAAFVKSDPRKIWSTGHDAPDHVTGLGSHPAGCAVAEVVVEYLRPIRAKALELLEDEAHLIKLLHEGAEKARTVASSTLSDAYKNLGLVK